jgi:hypothetical protein
MLRHLSKSKGTSNVKLRTQDSFKNVANLTLASSLLLLGSASLTSCGKNYAKSKEPESQSSPVGTTFFFTFGDGRKGCAEKTGEDGACKIQVSVDGKILEGKGKCAISGAVDSKYWMFTCDAGDGSGPCIKEVGKVVLNGNQKDSIVAGQTKFTDADTQKSFERSDKPCSEWLGTAAACTPKTNLQLVAAGASDKICASTADEIERAKCMAKTYDILTESSTGTKRCYSFDTSLSYGTYLTETSTGTLSKIVTGAMTMTYSIVGNSITDTKLVLVSPSSSVSSTLYFKPRPTAGSRTWTDKYSSKVSFETKGYCAAGLKEPAASSTNNETTTAPAQPTQNAQQSTPHTAAQTATTQPAPDCEPAPTAQSGSQQPVVAPNIEVEGKVNLISNFSGGVAVGYLKGQANACLDLTGASCTYKNANETIPNAKCQLLGVQINGGWKVILNYADSNPFVWVTIPQAASPDPKASQFISIKEGTDKIVKEASCPIP